MNSARVVDEPQRAIPRCDALIFRRLTRSTDDMPESGNIKAETKQFGTMKLDDFLEHPQSYAQKRPSEPYISQRIDLCGFTPQKDTLIDNAMFSGTNPKKTTPSPDRLKVEPRPTPGRHKGEAQ